ncbi:MAG: hypothetical protein QM662_09280 [Gordonia sp. (in: high G+C Gram-positive bacteria)]
MGKVMTIFGVLVVVVCVTVGVVFAVRGFAQVTTVTDAAYEIVGPTSHTYAAGDEVQLYVRGTANHYPEALPNCRVGGPAAPATGPNATNTFTYQGTSITSFRSYRFTRAGKYTLDCGDAHVIAAPPLSATGVVSGVGGVLLAVFGGGTGAVLFIIGIILWVVGRKRTPPPLVGYGHQA